MTAKMINQALATTVGSALTGIAKGVWAGSAMIPRRFKKAARDGR
ncbi:MAG: hypothetical protein U5J62_00705 [Desulfurivibrio sp.]|nr:hypothetical protein [Desulfurivibrio sp.]